MSEESRIESGARLARDMRKIREARHLSVNDVHEETKIPLGLIEAFEDRALFDHPQFNRVYLRSFARTYAQVIGIEADLVLQALEEALAGGYAGSLAVEYLGEKPVEQPSADAPTPAAPSKETEAPTEPEITSEPAGAATGESAPPPADVSQPEKEEPGPEESAERKRKKRDRGPAKRPQARKGEPPLPDEPKSPALVSTTGETAAGYERVQEEEAREEDWTSQSPPTGPRTPTHTRRNLLRQREPRRGWIIGAGAVILIGAIAFVLISILGEDREEAPDVVSAADTAAVRDTVASVRAPAVPAPTLGDTLNVQIIAAHDKVDPMRVTIDNDLRRPYWLDQGDSMAFRPLNRIVVEEQLENIVLKIEGVEYPTGRTDELGRIVITRDSIQNYFATRTFQ